MKLRSFNFPTLKKFKQTKNKIRKNFRDIQNQIQKNLNQSNINNKIDYELKNINQYYNQIHSKKIFETEWESPQTVLEDSTNGTIRAIEHTIRVEITKIPEDYISNIRYKILTSLGEGDPEFNPGPGLLAIISRGFIKNEVISIEDIEGLDNIKKVIIDIQMFLSNFAYSSVYEPSVPIYKFKLICNYPIVHLNEDEKYRIDRDSEDYL